MQVQACKVPGHCFACLKPVLMIQRNMLNVTSGLLLQNFSKPHGLSKPLGARVCLACGLDLDLKIHAVAAERCALMCIPTWTPISRGCLSLCPKFAAVDCQALTLRHIENALPVLRLQRK